MEKFNIKKPFIIYGIPISHIEIIKLASKESGYPIYEDLYDYLQERKKK